jgi:tRNA pseudouridine38-40 synthase
MRNRITPDKIQIALNDALPPDIHVRAVENARDNFHARHDATARIYLYQISTRRTAFAKSFVWWIKDRLDAAAMSEVLPQLTGMHDFVRFSDKRMVKESTKVLLEFVEIGVADDLILIRLGASHFLWKMVRKIISATVEVGRGKMSSREFAALLKPGEPYAPTAPPSGLFLEAITYEGEEFDRPLAPIVPVFGYFPTRVKKESWGNRKTRS